MDKKNFHRRISHGRASSNLWWRAVLQAECECWPASQLTLRSSAVSFNRGRLGGQEVYTCMGSNLQTFERYLLPHLYRSRTAVAPLERLKILMQVQGSNKVYTGVWQVGACLVHFVFMQYS